MQSTLTEDVAAIQAQREERQAVLSRLTEDVSLRSQDLVRIESQLQERMAEQNAMIEDDTQAFERAAAELASGAEAQGTQNPAAADAQDAGTAQGEPASAAVAPEEQAADAPADAGADAAAETPEAGDGASADAAAPTGANAVQEGAEDQTAADAAQEGTDDDTAAPAQDGAAEQAAVEPAQDAAGAAQTPPSIEAGAYVSEDLTLIFGDTGAFEITGGDQPLAGKYSLENGVLRLEAAAEGEDSGLLPLECEVAAGAEGGFEVPADQAECALLAGQSFAATPN